MAYTPTTWVEGVTKVGPTNLNHLETGVQATAVVSDAAIPKPAAPATNAGLVWNGSNWVAALLVNGNIDPAANIAYSKLTLASSIVNTDVASGAAIAYSKLSLTGGIVNSDVSASAAISQSKIAFADIGYAQITSNVNIASTTEATGTTIISPGAIVFDGTPVWVQFYTENLVSPSNAAGNRSIVSLFEGATQITRLCSVTTPAAANMGATATGWFKFTPTAASHTYTITAFADSVTGTPLVGAGAGGTATLPPAFVRFIKA